MSEAPNTPNDNPNQPNNNYLTFPSSSNRYSSIERGYKSFDLCCVLTSIIINIVFYWLFNSFTSSEEHYESALTCKHLLFHSKGLASAYYTIIALQIILLLFSMCRKDSVNDFVRF